MKSTAAKKEEFTFPSGGIADFYMEDHEIEALEKEEAEQEFGSAGIATFNPIARRMASYGRYGDDTVAHVETGELVVPKALIDSNPKLKDSIFSHLRELGVEDPEQYIVGSGVNSINPDTGMPEFFFKKIFKGIKKAVSGVARGVKKAFKGVGKILKKVAPVVLPIVLSMTGLGPIYGAALGSGIGTLVSGGDIKDAFKSALIAGGTGALFSGFTGKGASFTERVGNALSDPAGRLAQTAKGLKGTLTGKGLTGEGTLFNEFVPTTEVPTKTPITDASVDKFGVNRRFASTVDPAKASQTTFDMSTLQQPEGFTKTPGLVDSVKDAFTPGGRTFTESMGDIFLPSSATPTATDFMVANKGMPLDIAQQLAADAAKQAPGMLRTFGPAAAVAGLGAAAGGFFDKPEDPDLDIDDIQGVTGSDLLRDNPDAYMLAGRGSGTPGQVVVPTNYRFMGQMPDFRSIYPQFAADGGEIFPRRTGGIMPNEGTPGKDSVRAMLMPGEFVMTTDAVKGMGDGNNEKGINRMYDMMRNLESRGKAMA
tara:strand:- start:723 stop:2336 length:1614 start_codon:yes stop_codon:yes gene_type:complete